MATSKEVASIILQQLGGNKFIAMTGARHFGTNGNDLAFTLPRYPGLKINCVKITLNAMDTYDIDFLKVPPMSQCHKPVETIKRCEDIYNDQLQEVFTRYTGLDTHL